MEIQEVSNMDVNELNDICKIIEQMSKFNQIEILKIFCKYPEVTVNENKYGIHINLSEINNAIIVKIKTYIKYVNAQEAQLNNAEKEQENFKNIYFIKS